MSTLAPYSPPAPPLHPSLPSAFTPLYSHRAPDYGEVRLSRQHGRKWTRSRDSRAANTRDLSWVCAIGYPDCAKAHVSHSFGLLHKFRCQRSVVFSARSTCLVSIVVCCSTVFFARSCARKANCGFAFGSHLLFSKPRLAFACAFACTKRGFPQEQERSFETSSGFEEQPIAVPVLVYCT